MTDEPDGLWVDDEAGRLVRPYTVAEGRTRPSTHFDLLTLVLATGERPQIYLGPEHEQALGLCGGPISVAEVAAYMKLPAVVTKVLLADLVQHEALTTRAPIESVALTDRDTLEAVLRGLQKRL
jgi:hypothetical protein